MELATMKAISKTKTPSLGETAVEGLFGGLVAGLAMALVIIVIEAAVGVNPVTVLGYFDPNGDAQPVSGLLIHFAVAGVYGIGFGLLIGVLGAIRPLPGRIGMFALGGAFGLLILGIAEWIVFPHSNAGLQSVPLEALTLAHLVYGAVLGGMMGHANG